jgi:uncharacterized protein DUF1761
MLHVLNREFGAAMYGTGARSASLTTRRTTGRLPPTTGPTFGGGDIMKTNYPAVVVCAVVYWLVGALWYAVLFAKPWMALEGPLPNAVNPTLPYIVSFLLDLLIALVLAQICAWRNADSASRGAAIGIILWIGIVGPIVYTTYMYEGRPMELFAINEFYPLVGLCMMGAILGAWRKKAA